MNPDPAPLDATQDASTLSVGVDPRAPGAEAPSGKAGVVDAPSVSGYQILEVLGRGGMGVVYKAWQTALKRPVALKMILSGAAADPKELARFRAAAEASARLQHSNIVQIFEVGEHEQRPCLIMELIEGGSLARFLAGTPQPPGRCERRCRSTRSGPWRSGPTAERSPPAPTAKRCRAPSK
jgi:serine/threonine protein kinase